MQSTGQTSTHERSLMSMQGSAMMYVIADLLYRGTQLLDELPRPLLQRRLHDDVVEPRLVRAPQSGGVRVAREAEDRDVRIRVGDVGRIDARDVRDDEVGRVDRVRGNEVLPGERGLQLPPEEQIDPSQQDRRHAQSVERDAASVEWEWRSRSQRSRTSGPERSSMCGPETSSSRSPESATSSMRPKGNACISKGRSEKASSRITC